MVDALKATAQSHICRHAAATIFVSMLAINTVLLMPLYFQVEKEYHLNIQAQAESYLSSIIDAGRLPSIDVLVSMGNKLAGSSDLVGGVFVDSAGETKGVFGQRPKLTWAEMKLNSDGFHTHRDDSEGYHEFFIPGDRVGFNLGTIIRYDGSRLWDLMHARLLTFAILALMGTIGISIVIVVIMAMMVMTPLQRLNKAIARALDAPEHARDYLTGFDTDDEVGATSRSLDRLLTLLSTAHADNILTPAALMERLPNPIVTFDPEEKVINANGAAKKLFGCNVIADFATIDWSSCILVDGEAVEPFELAGNGSFQCGGELQVNGEPVACLIGGNQFIGVDGEFGGVCLIFTVASDLLDDMRREKQQRIELEEATVQLRRHNLSLKHMMDACVALIVGGEEKVQRISLHADRYIADWLSAGGAGDTHIAEVRHKAIPPILGDPQDGRRVFEWALTILAIRSTATESAVAIDVKVDDEDQVTFTFREPESPSSGDAGIAQIDPYADATILVGALGRLLTRQRGKLIRPGGTRDGNVIEFMFMLDAAGMVIMKAEQERKTSRRAA